MHTASSRSRPGPSASRSSIELEAFYPAPYLARAHWVATRDWNCLRSAEWQAELRHAHAVVFEKLPKRTRDALSNPAAKRSPTKAAQRTAR